jgi:SAM-dependent methyltransferase
VIAGITAKRPLDSDGEGAASGGGPTECLCCAGPLEAPPVLVGRDFMHGVRGRYEVFVCRRCGSGTTLPLAGPEEIAGYYSDEYAPYVPPRGALAAAMRILQRARDRRFPLGALRDRSPGVLLDVGCGRGDLCASWIQAGWRAVGVEPSPRAAAVARERGVETLVGTLDTVSLPAEAYDVAVFRHSLEHVSDPRADLRQVHAALRPGGRVGVIVPNWGSWQRRAFGDRWFPLELPRHRCHFSAEGLRRALAAAGFVDAVVRPGTPFITTTWSLQLCLFGRCLTNSGAALLAGYAASLPVAALVRPVDLLLRDGDFLHAAAGKPS